MSEELSVHLSIAASIMKEEIKSISKGKYIEFLKDGEVIIEDEPRNRILSLVGLSDDKYVFEFAGNIVGNEIDSLRWDRDFDIILILHQLSFKNKNNIGVKSSTGVVGHRKSG